MQHQNKYSGPREINLNLVQNAAAKQAMMERMRAKLAGPSQTHLIQMERKRAAARKEAFGWGWRLALVAAFIGANALYFGGKTLVGSVSQRPHNSHRLPPPSESLDDNQQALYWTYALYDSDRLREKFGVAKGQIVDAAFASAQIRSLLPRVDAQTRFIIDRYLPSPGKS